VFGSPESDSAVFQLKALCRQGKASTIEETARHVGDHPPD
jgi:hypothetical protein